MALKSTIKAPRKKKTRLAPAIKRGAKLAGPKFDGWEKWTGAEFSRFKRSAKTFYYENFQEADLLPEVWLWMKDNGYTPAQVKAAKAADGWNSVSVNTAIMCKLLHTGCPDISPAEAEYWESLAGTSGPLVPMSKSIKDAVERAIEKGMSKVEEEKKVEEKKKNTYVPSIQERILEQAYVAAEGIEEWLDSFVTEKSKFDPKGFDFKAHFQTMNVSQAHARKIISFYERELAEFRELQNMPTAAQIKKMDEQEADLVEQLKEGYKHLTKKDVSNYIAALEALVDACTLIIDASKATRKARTPKPKSADKLIAKLKYLKVDQKNSLASINPVEIIGANELWVFNTKTRKLGKYVAANVDPTGLGRAGSGLSVKGSSIIGFNEEASIQKTLRKPDVQLKEFKAAGKVALRKFLDGINTTDTKMNGRINADTVLLKVG